MANYNELKLKYEQLLSDYENLAQEIAKTKAELDAMENIYVKSPKTNAEKVALFLSLFKGRAEVCAKRWSNKKGYSPFCLNEFVPRICGKPLAKCQDCQNANYAPFDEARVRGHLAGKYVLGVYPITKQDTCHFLAIDFDEKSWREDVKCVIKVCEEKGIPAYLERSQSGNGCHIWFFFESELKAGVARQFGTIILDLAMNEVSTITFSSYDRMFPNQDSLTKNGFGNLIALPLQKEARAKGNSVFLNSELEPVENQWEYLSQIKKISNSDVQRMIKVELEPKWIDPLLTVAELGAVFGGNTGNNKHVTLTLNKGVIIDRSEISTQVLVLLRRLASYANPEFYRKQAMRLSTYGTPRMSVLYEEDEHKIILPRGSQKQLEECLSVHNIDFSIRDNRETYNQINVEFQGELTSDQTNACNEMIKFESGILSATTGFGKTVVAAKLIAELKQPTLVLVHTKELLIQWKARLEQFLLIDSKALKKGNRKSSSIGLLGGGRNSLKFQIDIALMQSMFEKDKSVKEVVQKYGVIIVDECHHVPADSFTKILRNISAKYVYGLTATPIRKDEHHPIMFMFCGPIRYRTDALVEANKRALQHTVIPRFSRTRMPVEKAMAEWHISEIYERICQNEARNQLIVSDILKSTQQGRNPLVLSERVSHIDLLEKMLKDEDKNLVVLKLIGSLTTRERRESLQTLRSITSGQRFVLLATGRLIGEGFDEARLDTLFLAYPIAWKGTVAQYAGRLHRKYSGKTEVIIYDYVDFLIPVLDRMFHKRLNSYKQIGYHLRDSQSSIGSVQEDVLIYSYQKEIEIQNENLLINSSSLLETSMNMDLSSAKRSILISSSGITPKKLKQFLMEWSKLISEGVRITICFSPQVDEVRYRNFGSVTQFATEQGVNMVCLKSQASKFIIIDHKLVWYGGYDLLGPNYEDCSMIRLRNEQLANDLLGSVSV